MQKLRTKFEYITYFMLVVRKRQKLIWLVGLSTCIALLAFGYLITPVWEGTARILVERSSKQNLGLFRDVDMPVAENDNMSEAALNMIPTLTGWNMAYDVVKEFHLDEREKQKAQNPPTVRDWVKVRMADVVYSPIYFLQWVGIMPPAEKDWVDEAADDLLDDWLDIELEEDTGVLDVTVYGETPELATNVANSMVRLLQEKTQNFGRVGAKGSIKFVEQQLAAATATLNKSQDDLARFKARNQLFSVDEDRKLKIDKLDEFETALLNINKEYQETKAKLAAVTKELGRQPERKIVQATIAKNPTVEMLENRLADLEVRKASLLVEKEPQHPDVAAVQAQIDSAHKEIEASVKEAIQAQTEAINPTYQTLVAQAVDLNVARDTLVARKSAFLDIVADLKKELTTFPAKEIELGRLAKIVDIDQAMYDALKNRLVRLQIEGETTDNEYTIRIMDSAFVPPSRDQDWPLWWLNILVGVFLGVIFGFGAAFVAEYWNEPVLTLADVEEGMGVPFLGRVPKFNSPAA